MKTLRTLLALLLITAAIPCLGAESSTSGGGDIEAKMKQIITSLQEKMKAGKRTETDYADELKQMNALAEANKKEKPEEASQILMMEVQMYLELFEEAPKAVEIVKQIKKDYPESKSGQNADKILASIAKIEETQKIQQQLKVGTAFPDSARKTSTGSRSRSRITKGRSCSWISGRPGAGHASGNCPTS